MALRDQNWFASLNEALAINFDAQEFERLVHQVIPSFEFEERAGYDERRAIVLEQAYQEQWLGELIEVALHERPDSATMLAAAEICWEEGIYDRPMMLAEAKSVELMEAAPPPRLRSLISSVFGRFRSATQTRRLDAAMPKQSTVGQTTEVRAMVALADSVGLRAFLPDFTESGDLIERDDVTGQPVTVHFEREAQPVTLYLKLEAADDDFDIEADVQSVQVFSDRDSGIVTFFLKPLRSLRRGRVAVLLYEDEDLQTQLGSVTVFTRAVTEPTDLNNQTWTVASSIGDLPFVNRTLHELVALVAECDCMDDPGSRDDFLRDLPAHIRNHVERRAATFDDVRNILRRCMQVDDGLDQFLALLRDYEGAGSKHFQAVDNYLQQLEAESEP